MKQPNNIAEQHATTLDKLRGSIEKFLIRKGTSAENAQDIAADTIEVLLKAQMNNYGNRFVDAEEIKKFAFGVCEKLWLRFLRRQMKTSLCKLSDSESYCSADFSAILFAIDLQAAVDCLPDTLRAAFMLHDVAKLSHEQVAATLNISIPASRVYSYRARAIIRKSTES